MAILKEDVVLNADVFNYLMNIDFQVLDYFPKLRILKLEYRKPLPKTDLKYIKSIEVEKTLSI